MHTPAFSIHQPFTLTTKTQCNIMWTFMLERFLFASNFATSSNVTCVCVCVCICVFVYVCICIWSVDESRSQVVSHSSTIFIHCFILCFCLYFMCPLLLFFFFFCYFRECFVVLGQCSTGRTKQLTHYHYDAWSCLSVPTTCPQCSSLYF